MTRKKQKKTPSQKPQPSDKLPEGKLQHSPFAQALQGRKKALGQEARRQEEARLEAARQRQQRLEQAARDQRQVLAAEDFVQGRKVEMTPEELFAAALDGLDAVQIAQGKFGAGGPVTSHVQLKDTPQDEPEDDYARQDRIFAMQFDWDGVEKMEHNLYVPEPPTREEIDAMYRFKQQPHTGPGQRESQVEAILGQGRLSLSADQARLLEQVRPCQREGKLREISIRKLSRDAALQCLEVNLRACAQQDQRLLRVITGKGLQSAGEPVLKRMLVEWCLSMDIAYAPEILADGTFGSFILRPPRA